MEIMNLVERIFRPKSNAHDLIDKKIKTSILLNNLKNRSNFSSILPRMDDFSNLEVQVVSKYSHVKIQFQFEDKRSKPSLKTVYAFSSPIEREPGSVLRSIRSVADKLLEEKRILLSYGYHETSGFRFERSFKLSNNASKFKIIVFREVEDLEKDDPFNNIYISFKPMDENMKSTTWRFDGISMNDAVLKLEKVVLEEDKNFIFTMSDGLRDDLINKNDVSGSFVDVSLKRVSWKK